MCVQGLASMGLDIQKCAVLDGVVGTRSGSDICYLMGKRLFSEKERYQIERILAAAFITEGIGYDFGIARHVMSHHNYYIDNAFYTNSMTSVTRNVFRKIESLMEQQKGQGEIQKLAGEKFTMIRASLIKAKEWLNAQQMATFVNLVKVTYNLKGYDECILPERVKLLYNRIIHYLEKQRAFLKKRKRVESKIYNHFSPVA